MQEKHETGGMTARLSHVFFDFMKNRKEGEDMANTCWNCFQTKPNGGVCPFCGYDPEAVGKKYPLALKEGAILNGRYTVGRVLGQGGFSGRRRCSAGVT